MPRYLNLSLLAAAIPLLLFAVLSEIDTRSVLLANETLPTVVRVEEDWELDIAIPDSNSVAPQVTCVSSPQGDVSTVFCAFDINHRSQPGFQGGGMQLHIWDGAYTITSQAGENDSIVVTNNDTVRWTQIMSIVDGQLVVEVVNGTSNTWGPFGGPGEIHACTSTSLTDLNGYSPTVSVANSGVGYARNRVNSLVLKRIRLITDTGAVLEDATERVVHSLN